MMITSNDNKDNDHNLHTLALSRHRAELGDPPPALFGFQEDTAACSISVSTAAA